MLALSALVKQMIPVMPDTTDNSKTIERITGIPDYTTLPFWFFVWAGTTVAGGAYGFLVGCWGAGLPGGIFCLIVGVVLASILGAFTVAHVAFVTWCFWLSRLRVVLGGLAGGLTGFTAALSVSGGASLIDAWTWLLLPALFGALGGGLAGGRYHAREGLAEDFLPHRWRFTLRDLFVRLTVLSVFLATDVFVVNLIFADHP